MEEGKVVFQGKHKDVDLLIRYPTAHDIQILLNFINALSLERTYIRFQGETVTFEEEEQYVKGYIEQIKRRKAVKLLAFHNDILIGVGDIGIADKIESHVGTFGLTVAKEWRGKGIGGFLMDLTLTEAEKEIQGLRIIRLGVFANNPIAQRMYEKRGFRTYGVLPGGIVHKGEYIDHLYMCKKVH